MGGRRPRWPCFQLNPQVWRRRPTSKRICSLLNSLLWINGQLEAPKLPTHHISQAILCMEEKFKNKYTESSLSFREEIHIRSLTEPFFSSESLHWAFLSPDSCTKSQTRKIYLQCQQARIQHGSEVTSNIAELRKRLAGQTLGQMQHINSKFGEVKRALFNQRGTFSQILLFSTKGKRLARNFI